MKHTLAAIVALSILSTACGADSAPSAPTSSAPAVDSTPATVTDPRTPVILDYSPTVSDMGALFFLAVHPDIRLIAVTLPGTGESHCEPGVAHTRGALEALGLGDIPVACGPESGPGPLNPFPAGWRERSDVIDLPEAAPNEARTAPQLIADLVAASPTPVQIVAVGPLTNLAVALAEHPGIGAGIGAITIMGGAVDAPGNVPPVPGWEQANAHAEVNFWVDPTSAALVFASGIPIVLVPLDATNSVPTDEIFYSALASVPATPASLLLRQVWDQAPEWVDGYFLWDELAAAVLVDESVVQFVDRRLVVDDGDAADAGWSRDDPNGFAVRVAVSADRAAFEHLFLGTLLGREIDLGRLAATGAEAAYFTAVEAIAAEYDESLAAVLDDAAIGLGIDPTDEQLADEEWIQILVAAAPAIVDGPMTALLQALDAVAAPPALADLHSAWIDALGALVLNRDEFLGSLGVTLAADPPGPIPYLSDVQESCLALQTAADELALTARLGC